MTARSFRSCVLPLLACLIAPIAAHAGTYSSLAAFQQNIRADAILEPFNGPDSLNLPPIMVAGNGYAFTVSAAHGGTVIRRADGVSYNTDSALLYTFTGKPTTAFAATLRMDDFSLNSAGGTMRLQTDAGDDFMVTVAAGSTFFGFTNARPFTSITITPATSARIPFTDDVYVGTSGTAIIAGDQCSDAPTIRSGATTQYPFTTVGATAEVVSNSCSGGNDSGPDVWFRFVSPATGRVTAGTCGCNFDTILRAFDSCPVGGSGAIELDCSDDACIGGPAPNTHVASEVFFRVQAGEDYLFRISGYNNASGSGNLTLSLVPDCAADFNHFGGNTIQDIFDFLAAWFSACP
jgi:hypothetical protein